MTTIGTIFSGGEGIGVGAKAAGLTHLWGVEYEDKIADVARMNGFNTLTGDVRDGSLMRSLPRPDVLHASPVCKNASNAKTDGEESPLDIETADATCAYIDHFKPDIFTLENVWGYRTFEAFAHILIALKRNHYQVNFWHLNAADYGVPQTRKRLILVARWHGKPIKPLATHARPDKITPMFDTRKPWIGWYAAIEDLINTLPLSRFAPWQLERIPNGLMDCYLCEGTDTRHDLIISDKNDPSFTIKASHYKGLPAGFLTPNANTSGIVIRYSDQPAPTQGNVERVGNQPRAFIVHANDMRTMPISKSDEPIFTTTAGSFDTSHTPDTKPRAWLSSGYVVKMTTRALARFQSIPDSYILPDKVWLACTIIGNSVPPLLYQRVIEAQL